MNTLQNDLILDKGIEGFYKDFRSGKITSLEVTDRYLDKIKKHDGLLGAFQYVDVEGARMHASAMDRLIQEGIDLGSLMGLPVAVKDVLNIDGFPAPKCGSKVNLQSILSNNESTLISALKKGGAVILGTTKTVEFCFGITGISETLGTPWNACDLQEQRIPGGSSSGSAVACAADMCAYAIGTDTGGSVRVPAAFNGIFGLKTTYNRWPLDNYQVLLPKIDSLGIMTKTAKDARLVFTAIEKLLFGVTHYTDFININLKDINFGIPMNHFYDDLSVEVSEAIDKANNILAKNGSNLKNLSIPQANERDQYFKLSLPANFISIIGWENFINNKNKIDPIIAKRLETSENILAYDLLSIERQRENSIKEVNKIFDHIDVLACPTTTTTALRVKDFEDYSKSMKYALGMSKNSQPVNYFEQCAVNIPLRNNPNDLPVGFQLISKPNNDGYLLDIAVAVEDLFNDHWYE